jgi:hypothetical protein
LAITAAALRVTEFKASVAVRAIFVAEEPHSQIESWLPAAVPVVRAVTGLALVVA